MDTFLSGLHDNAAVLKDLSDTDKLLKSVLLTQPFTPTSAAATESSGAGSVSIAGEDLALQVWTGVSSPGHLTTIIDKNCAHTVKVCVVLF